MLAKIVPAPPGKKEGPATDTNGIREPEREYVNLRLVAQDTYEYHGLRYLLARIVYWVLVVSAFFAAYTREQIVNSANMVSTLAFLEGPNGETIQFKDQNTFSDATGFMFDVASHILAPDPPVLSDLVSYNASRAYGNTSKGDGPQQPLPPPSKSSSGSGGAGGSGLRLGDYSQLQVMRLVVDLDKNCRYTTLHCADHDGAAPSSALWLRQSNGPWWLYNKHVHTAVVYDAQGDAHRSGDSDGGAGAGDALAAGARLTELAVDVEFLSVYGNEMLLEVVCDHTLFPGKLTWVALNVHRDQVEQRVKVQVMTLDLYGDRLVSGLVFFLMIIVVVITLGYLGVLLRSIYLYDLQRMRKWRGASAASGVPGQEPPRRAGRLWSLATFFTYSLWNTLELLCLFICFIWFCMYLYMAADTLHGAYYSGRDNINTALSREEALNELLQWGSIIGALYQVGALCVLLTGLSVYPYFRVHSGLRLYLAVLSAAWRAVLDFMVFFAFIFLLIGAFCLASSQLPGVQPNLTYPTTAFSALAMLMLGFYSYDDFVNSAVPKTTLMACVQDAVFWVAVIMLFILVQNILLAIMAVAYDEARLVEGSADCSFLLTLLIWLSWWPVTAYLRLWRRLSWVEVTRVLEVWPDSSFTRYYKRWAIASTSEAQALQSYYTFFLNWHFRPRSPWLHNPFKGPSRPDDRPPDSITAPLSRDELLAALLQIGSTPSFQRLCMLTYPWPLHRLRAYSWHSSSCEDLADMVWRCYRFRPSEEGVMMGARGSERDGRWVGRAGRSGVGRWMFASAIVNAMARREGMGAGAGVGQDGAGSGGGGDVGGVTMGSSEKVGLGDRGVGGVNGGSGDQMA